MHTTPPTALPAVQVVLFFNDDFFVDEFVEAFFAEFASVTGVFDSAEGSLGGGSKEVIHGDGSCVHTLRDRIGPMRITAKNGAS